MNVTFKLCLYITSEKFAFFSSCSHSLFVWLSAIGCDNFVNVYYWLIFFLLLFVRSRHSQCDTHLICIAMNKSINSSTCNCEWFISFVQCLCILSISMLDARNRNSIRQWKTHAHCSRRQAEMAIGCGRHSRVTPASCRCHIAAHSQTNNTQTQKNTRWDARRYIHQ